MAEVSILLSTYNGEKYVKEQIQSLLNQTYTNWELFMRDDGSSDETVNILKEMAAKDPRLHLLPQDGNKGVIESFFIILEVAKSPYYMFCDQDDVWLPEKIEKTLSLMKKTEKVKAGPILVHTDLKVVDENLQEIAPSFMALQKMSPERDSFQSLILQNNITGCTVMINEALKEKYRKKTNLLMHDHWLGLVAAAFGTIAYLPEATILYRQHGKNTVGASKAGLALYLKKAQQIDKSLAILKKGILQGKDFYELYQNELDDKNKEFLKEYINSPHESSVKRRRFLRKYHLQKNTWWRNSGFRYLFIYKL